VRYDTDQPRNHCNARQVFGKLLGNSLAQFQDQDGSYTSLIAMLDEDLIPEISSMVVSAIRTPLDWCRRVYFASGTGDDTIVLPNRYIAGVNVVFIRILPSMPWYRFSRFRAIDGTEFNRAGFLEPPNTPAFQAPYSLETSGATPPYTGIEDADILVDTNARTIIIPPRALLLTANAAVPFSSYSFIPGRTNIEIHYTFGFPPTKYFSGAPLQFDPDTGAAIELNPAPPNPLPQGVLIDGIDWSSGMPRAVSNGVSRIVANRILRQNWRGISNGLASLSVDGGSESYGSKAYSGDLDDEEQAILSLTLPDFGIQMVI
jgi:hypothetical protein